MPMMYGWNSNWGAMLLMMLLNAAVWIGLIGVLIWAAGRWLTNRSTTDEQSRSGPSALEILRQRYARGEIDEATFERMRQQLEVPAARDALTIPPAR